jgi:hypothetical protein
MSVSADAVPSPDVRDARAADEGQGARRILLWRVADQPARLDQSTCRDSPVAHCFLAGYEETTSNTELISMVSFVTFCFQSHEDILMRSVSGLGLSGGSRDSS